MSSFCLLGPFLPIREPPSMLGYESPPFPCHIASPDGSWVKTNLRAPSTSVLPPNPRRLRDTALPFPSVLFPILSLFDLIFAFYALQYWITWFPIQTVISGLGTVAEADCQNSWKTSFSSPHWGLNFRGFSLSCGSSPCLIFFFKAGSC